MSAENQRIGWHWVKKVNLPLPLHGHTSRGQAPKGGRGQQPSFEPQPGPSLLAAGHTAVPLLVLCTRPARVPTDHGPETLWGAEIVSRSGARESWTPAPRKLPFWGSHLGG